MRYEKYGDVILNIEIKEKVGLLIWSILEVLQVAVNVVCRKSYCKGMGYHNICWELMIFGAEHFEDENKDG